MRITSAGGIVIEFFAQLGEAGVLVALRLIDASGQLGQSGSRVARAGQTRLHVADRLAQFGGIVARFGRLQRIDLGL